MKYYQSRDYKQKAAASFLALLMVLTAFTTITIIPGSIAVKADELNGDTTPPIQTFEVGEPKIPITWHSNPYYIIGPYTPIYINSTDSESGSYMLTYSVWLAEDLTKDPIRWQHLPQYDTTLYDIDEDGTISAVLFLTETCFHEIRYQCWDNEGNTDGLHTNDLFVDASTPVTLKDVGCPQYGLGVIQPPWANNQTPLIFTTYDESCFPEGTGVAALIVKVWWKQDTCDVTGTLILIDTIIIHDNDANDQNPEYGIIVYEFHFQQSGFYELEYYGIDYFGNTELAWKQQHRVDVEPPSITKIHPTHGYMRINEHEGYLKCGLSISLTAQDEPIDTCNAGFDRLFWRYEYQGILYPDASTPGAIDGATIAEQFCFNDPNIENYYWYLYTTEITFNEECQHDLYYFATDNLGNYEIHHQIYYVDCTEPYMEVTYPDHGYYAGTVDHLKSDTPITLNAYDNPDHLCQAGIESIFWRYEWNGYFYPDGPNEGVVSGLDLAAQYNYSADYNIPEITDYYWYYTNDPSVMIEFGEQCQHDLYFFTKDNVCQHSIIYELTFYVDNEAPITFVSYPDHGYYENDFKYIKANTWFTVDAVDQPYNDCAAGIESIFWRYEWNDGYYPNEPDTGVVSGWDLVSMYGADYNTPEITDYCWYFVDAASVNIAFPEECRHEVYYFAKDNVCHRSMIYRDVYYVDNSSPIVDIEFPDEHGYYDHHIRSNLPFTIMADDLPDSECAAGIEALFYRWEYGGLIYPDEPGEGVISGQELVTLYGEDYNIPEITDNLWYFTMDSTATISFAEDCAHDLYFFAKDNVCHRGDIFHETIYVDDENPTVSLELPGHGYYPINDISGYLKEETDFTIHGTDYPDNECGSGIEAVFYRFEWNEGFYPNEPGTGVIYGEDLVGLYGSAYDVPEITMYWWYIVEDDHADVSFDEQCKHEVFFFVKDNLCHRSDISSHTFFVDDMAPYIYYQIPEGHGYYFDQHEDLHMKCGYPITFYAEDLPENDCAAGIESIFWRYEWDGGYYPSGPGDDIIYGPELVSLYGEDYNYAEFTDYYWYIVDDTTLTVQFPEECQHDLYYFVKDNVCHHSGINHDVWYIDCSVPTTELTSPTHGYVPMTDTSGYLKIETDITLTATDHPDGDCGSGIESIFWRYEYDSTSYPTGPGDNIIHGLDLVSMYGEDYNIPEITSYYWYYTHDDQTNIMFYEQCQHDLYYFAKDNLCNHGPIIHHTLYVDATLPMVTMEHGIDGYVSIEEQDYIRCDTPIWINATDDGTCQAGIESIFYRYMWNDSYYPSEPGTGVASGYDLVTMYGETYNIPEIVEFYWYRVDAATTTIYFTEDCTHDIYYFAKDNVCQHTEVYYHEFHVDCTPPEIIKEVGYPNCVVVEDEEYCITSQTPIYIDAYDLGCCPMYDIDVAYKINDGEWIPISGPTTIYMTESCTHILTIRATDCVGNTAYDVETFHVDNSAPLIIKTVGEPNLVIEEGVEYCVNQQTQITVETQEQGCCSYGVVSVEYRIGFNDQWTEWMPYEGPINFTEDCNHTLEIRATDCLGNTAYDTELFHVDSIPPTINKTVGYPRYPPTGEPPIDEFGHDVWMVYPQTRITLTAEDAGCCPCPDPVIYYRYWFLGQWTDWMVYTEPFNFNRGCLHYLEAYTIDCLGNMGPIDNETFIVHVPDGYDDPLIRFDNPVQDGTYCERTLDVKINVSDAQTPTQDLTVVLWIPEGRRGAPTLWYETTYCPADNLFHAAIDIFKYQNGAEITLEAYVLDSDGNYVFAIPVTFTVCSNTGYDQWMELGWNSLVIPWGNVSCSFDVEDVLGSIYCHYTWVYYYDEVTDQWSSWYKYRDPGFNSLTIIEPGKQYWVYMETADQYYTDTIAPMVMINTPMDESILNELTEVTGTAYDNETGLKCVEVMIYDTTTMECWDGDSWEPTPAYLLCCGTETWVYNVETVAWISGHIYEITAIATDMVGCQATDMISFMWDTNPPMITILDPPDEEERTEGPGDLNFEVVDLECYVTDVYVQIYDQTSMLYFNGMNWQADPIWLDPIYDTDDQWYYPTYDIWPVEVPHTYQITVEAYDCIYNMGTKTSTFTIVEQQGECDADRTYTTDSNFNEGTFSGGVYAENDQLQLTHGEGTTYPVMWIANSGESSVSKWDTNENKELARYKTFFYGGGSHSGPAPSRTCVDSDGNCYVANRQFDGSKSPDVLKILANDFIDRNSNGVMDTSYDANANGFIEPSEMMPLVDTNGNNKIDPDEIQDERIAWAVEVGPLNGLGRSLSIDLDGNIWLGCYNAQQYYKISGVDGSLLAGPINTPGHTPYGSLVDKHGILWGASLTTNMLRLDTNTLEVTIKDHAAYGGNYGIALGYDSSDNTIVYLGSWQGHTFIKYDSFTDTFSTPAAIKYSSRGIATDSEGNILAGYSGSGLANEGGVSKFAPDGTLIWSQPSQVGSSEARGVVVDSNDNVWTVNLNVDKIAKYQGTDGAPLGWFPTGSDPYTYSDAAGLSYSGSVVSGKWNVVHDSIAPGTTWNKVSWNADTPEGTTITVKVRSSEDENIWSPWEDAENGIMFMSTPAGRYIEIEVAMKITSGETSPILYDLTVDGTCAGEPQCEPVFSLEKKVWRALGDFGYWDDYTEADIGDIIRFNISIEIPENGCEIEGGILDDYLPSELSYIPESTVIRFYWQGEFYDAASGEDCDPEIIPNGEINILHWSSQQGYGEYLPADSVIYLEFEAEVLGCGTLENIAYATANYSCCAPLQLEDSAEVWVYCEDEPPEGSGATIDPETLIVTLPPGGSTTEHKTVTLDEIPIGKLDVLFCFDLTGSMGSVLSTAKSSAIDIMNDIREQIPDSSFGVSSFMDYPAYYSSCGYSSYYGSSGDYPWSLDQDITSDTSSVSTAINGLLLGSGYDGPESYARALYESQFIDWRQGARKIVIIFEDDLPHDCTMAADGCDYYGDSTGVDPGRDAIAETADDLVWNDVIQDLKDAKVSVVVIDSGYDYGCSGVWQHVADETGGVYAWLDDYDTLPEQIVDLVEETTSTISHLTFEPREGYEDWFSWTPEEYTDVEGGEMVEFDVTITVPEGTAPGEYHTWLMVVGDGSILAVQEQWITVAEGGELGSISGNIYHYESGPSPVVVYITDTWPPVTMLDTLIFDEYPISYTFNDLPAGTYYIGAWMDSISNMMLDSWELRGYAINKSWYADPIVVNENDVTGANIMLFGPNPDILMTKYVWDGEIWVDGEPEPVVEVDVGDTVWFNVSAHNDGTVILNGATLTDTLPEGLSYVVGSATVFAVAENGQTWYYNATEPESQPTITTNPDNSTTLFWQYWQTAPIPPGHVQIEYAATVTDCNEAPYENLAVGDAYYDVNTYHAEDTALVQGICQPESSIAFEKTVWDGEIWVEEMEGIQHGDILRFDLGTLNTGNTDLTDVKIHDVLPYGFIYYYNSIVEAESPYTFEMHEDPDSHSIYHLWWNFSEPLQPGHTIAIQFDSKMNEHAEAEYVENAASATGFYDNGIITGIDSVKLWYYFEPENQPPIIDISFPEDGTVFDYIEQGGIFSITGTAYDMETFVAIDDVSVALYYNDGIDNLYYGFDAVEGWGWRTTEFWFPTSQSGGTGTFADPLYWQLLIEPGFPDPDKTYFVHAKAYDQTMLLGEDTNWFTLNHAPNIPELVSPANEATDVSVDTLLSWTCTDPDPTDTLHYTVCFDYAYPPASHAGNILDTTYDPGTITYNQTYYWQIIAYDNHGKSTAGPIWSFTTEEEPLYSISGMIYNDASGYGPVIISIVDSWPAGPSLDFEIYDSSSLPAPYSFNSLEAGTYYVEAFIDLNGNYVYDDDEPYGFAINKIDSPDPLIIVDGDISDADVTLYDTEEPQGLVHNINTDEWFMEIQTAIDDPDTVNGHIIVAHTATYNENVVINKEIHLIADSQPIIDAMGRTGISIEANNVMVHGFQIINAEQGIECFALGFLIQNNTITSNYDGIDVEVWTQGSHLSDYESFVIEDSIIFNNQITTDEVDSSGIRIDVGELGYQNDGNSECSIGAFIMTQNTIRADYGIYIDYITYLGSYLNDSAQFSFGGLFIINNTITASVDGIYINELTYYGYEIDDDTMFTMDAVLINNNIITAGGYGIYTYWIGEFGEYMYDTASYEMGDIQFNGNIIESTDIGIYLDYPFYDFGCYLNGDNTFVMGDFTCNANHIASSAEGIYVGYFQNVGYDMYGSSTYTMGDITFNDNLIGSYQSPAVTDEISSTVHLSRNYYQGIYNSVTESYYNDYHSPENTEWSPVLDDPVVDPTALTYTDWEDAVYPPPSMVGKVVYMHIITEDRYFEMHFDFWQSGGGGGFGYTRYEIINGIAENPVTFNRPNIIGAIQDAITIDFVGSFGIYMYDSSMFTMGNLECDNNNIVCDSYGIYMYEVPYEFGNDMSGSSSFTMGDFTINNNEIQSGLESIYVEYLQYLGESLYDSSSFTMGNVECCYNTITADADDGIQYDEIYEIGYGVYDSSSFTMGSFLFNHNDITSGDYGMDIYWDYIGEDIDDDSTFTMDNIEACNNTIDSAFEGMYLNYYSIGEGVYQNAIYTMGDILVNDNTITSGDDGIYVSEIDDLGYDVEDNAVFTAGNIEFQRNTINAEDNGIYFDYISDLGYSMSGDSTCTYGDILVCQNTIISTAKGIAFNEISIGYDMTDTTSVNMGDFKVNNNQITSIGSAIDFNSNELLMIGYILHGHSSVTMGNIEFNNNIINDSAELTICTDGLGDNVFDSAVVTIGDILVENNQVINSTDTGIFIYASEDVIVRGNTVTNAYGWGILVMWGGNNIIEDNIVTDSMEAIQVYISNDNTLNGNTFTGSEDGRYGIDVWSSSGNLIYNNYLDNPQNAFDNGANTWNIAKTLGTNIIGGPYLGGNYFSDYSGSDGDSDGLGDTPYLISGGSNQDNYPLVIPSLPVHNFDTGEDFPTIQTAIDDADTGNGHTIQADAQTYYENVVITKAVSIIGSYEGIGNATLDAGGSGYGFYIEDIVGVYIENFRVTNAHYGLYIDGCDETTITGNDINVNTLGGIYLLDSDNCDIGFNDISSNLGPAIHAEYCDGNLIQANTITLNDGFGILLNIGCDGNEVFGNTVSHNTEHAVYLYQAQDNILQSNMISNNEQNGINVYTAINNQIIDNTISGNFDYGILLYSASEGNTITGNTIINHSDDIAFLTYNSDNNLIYNNYFNNSMPNAVDENTNTWYITPVAGTNIIGGSWIAGNYWSDYTGTDLNNDGLGDTPYQIFGLANQDNYPLVPPQSQMGIILSSDTYTVGDTFSATVYIDPIEAISGWEIYLLTFDPSLVQANTVTAGTEWTTFFDAGDIDNSNGEITEIETWKTDNYPDYNHTACEISFTALQPGQCTITLVTVEITNTAFEIIPVTAHTATVTINVAP